MKLSKPKYFDEFRCIAGACPDSCCKEWSVVVDGEKAAFYRSLEGDLGDRLRQVLEEEDGETVMAIEDGRCPMWRADGLCRVQAELGESALCNTCRDFPRLTHDYGDFVERQLELSCPVAAELILHGCRKLEEQDVPGGEAPEYDMEAMGILLRTRQEALELLEDQSLPAQSALASLLIYSYSVQNELDGGEVSAAPRRDLHLQLPEGAGRAYAVLNFFSELEILTPQWKKRLTSPMQGAWSEDFRALASYFVMRYWLQAVADYDLVARVKLIVVSCLVIKLLGGDVCATAQLYSKEIENDADNVDAILDGAYDAPALTDANLLVLLLAT